MDIQAEQAAKIAQLTDQLQELTRKAPAQTIIVPWAPFEASTTMGLTASANVLAFSMPDLTATLTRSSRSIKCFLVTARVNTTNNASNYWSIIVRRMTAAGGYVNLTSLSTAAMTAGTWTALDSGVLSGITYASANNLGLTIYVNKVGSPGALDFLCPLVYVI